MPGNPDKDRHEEHMPPPVIILRVWHDSTPCTFESSRLGVDTSGGIVCLFFEIRGSCGNGKCGF